MENVRLHCQNGEIWVTMPLIPTTTTAASGTSSAAVTSFSLSAHLRNLISQALENSKPLQFGGRGSDGGVAEHTGTKD